MPFPLLSDHLLDRLKRLSPAGFRLGRHLRITDRQKDLFDHMPPEWSAIYNKKNYAFGDPVFLWTVYNSGTIRWSEIGLKDYRGILKEARSFGLNYGAVIARSDEGRLSVLSVSHSERELTDEEIEECSTVLDDALRERHLANVPKPGELDVLSHLAKGLSIEDSAARLGVAISTNKYRLSNARRTLGAKTTTEAVAEAIKRKLI